MLLQIKVSLYFLLSDFQSLGILAFFYEKVCVQILFSELHTFAPQIFLAFLGFKLLKLLSSLSDHFHSP